MDNKEKKKAFTLKNALFLLALGAACLLLVMGVNAILPKA